MKRRNYYKALKHLQRERQRQERTNQVLNARNRVNEARIKLVEMKYQINYLERQREELTNELQDLFDVCGGLLPAMR